MPSNAGLSDLGCDRHLCLGQAAAALVTLIIGMLLR